MRGGLSRRFAGGRGRERVDPDRWRGQPHRGSVNLMALPMRLMRICRIRIDVAEEGIRELLVATSALSSIPLAWSADAERFEHVGQRVTEVEIGGGEFKPAGFDLGEIEKIVDDGEEGIGGGFDHVDKFACFVRP